MAEADEPSYIDYETFLDPTFSATAFANTLVLQTNNSSDTNIDLSTPLSKVLFDVQEVDTHIDSLTSKSALPLLTYTKDNVQASDRILQELEKQVATLNESYERLAKEVIVRHEAAEEVRLAADRLWQTVRLGRVVSRCLTLGRQLEGQMSEFRGTGSSKKEDYRAMTRAANTVLSLRQIYAATHSGGEGEGLERITVARTLRTDLLEPTEKGLLARAEQVVGTFSMSTLTSASTDSGQNSTGLVASAPTYAQAEDTRSKATSALITLYLLSPVPDNISRAESFEPAHLTSALQEYLKRSITSSLSGLSSALATLPKLDRALLEVSARCQNIVALEMLLDSIKPPVHPFLPVEDLPEKPPAEDLTGMEQQEKAPSNLLQPLLIALDTSSLPSYFWRSMASQLSSRVQKILRDGGVSARTLRSSKDRVRDAIRECVNRGSQLPASSLGRGKSPIAGAWEREAAVMVGSVINQLGR